MEGRLYSSLIFFFFPSRNDGANKSKHQFIEKVLCVFSAVCYSAWPESLETAAVQHRCFLASQPLLLLDFNFFCFVCGFNYLFSVAVLYRVFSVQTDPNNLSVLLWGFAH